MVGLTVKEWTDAQALRDEFVLKQAKETVKLAHIADAVARGFCKGQLIVGRHILDKSLVKRSLTISPLARTTGCYD